MQFRPTVRSVTFRHVPTTSFACRRLLGASLAVLVLGLGIAACGGGDDGEDAPAPVATTTPEETVALTTDELIEQGDAICDEANSALGSILSSTADETTTSAQVSGIYDGIAQQLGDLGTPSDGDPPTDVIAAAQDLADGSTDTTEFQTAATEYGFTDCAESPSAVTYTPAPTDGSSTDSSTGETYVPPTTVPEETYVPPTTTVPDSSGGGVAPPPPDTSGGSSGGTSSGGIGPG